MDKTHNLNKTSWFLNPWFDTIFLAGFPTAFVIIFLLNYPYFRLSPYSYSFYINFYLYSILNFTHILSGISIVYLDQRERKGKSLMFAWIPLLFLLSMIIFAFLGMLFNFTEKLATFRHWWGSFHNFLQSYFILELYRLRNHDYLKVDKRIDTLFLFGCYMNSPLRSLLFTMTKYGHIDTNIIKYFFIFWRILVPLIVIAFIIRQVYLFIQYKKVYLFKILMVSAAFIVYYYLLITTGNGYVAHKGQVELHNIQWIAWVWFYSRQKFKEGIIKEARFISYLSQPGRARLYIFLLMLFSVAFNFFVLIFSRGVRMPFNTALALIQSPLALFHFFIEIFIWRASSMRRIVTKST